MVFDAIFGEFRICMGWEWVLLGMQWNLLRRACYGLGEAFVSWEFPIYGINAVHCMGCLCLFRGR